ncbi:hypothetical protein JDV02_008921 [Purpureocillium takamizusanense]|uniref:Uncharacterized protein n=1 Tax=Purpureocillium takamizusanense TaxID=2060973 RepID=A0A9Q8QPN2_9HYPO|nr:uncharacterized protein JDV02_008921 [Purpureocillium takamizusanense]UNI23082.1 hypothetical protein JDV02_008921 [Purpureocillium takamizusanense]
MKAALPKLEGSTMTRAVRPCASSLGPAPPAWDAKCVNLAHDAAVRSDGDALHADTELRVTLRKSLRISARATQHVYHQAENKNRLAPSQGHPGLDARDLKPDGVDMMAMAARQLGIMLSARTPRSWDIP